MKYIIATILSLSAFVANSQEVTCWLTKADQSILFEPQPHKWKFEPLQNILPSIYVDASKTFQQIDGFGYTLTGASAMLINQMKSEEKKALLKELFTTQENGIGVSYLRISVGASDLSTHIFTYDDLPMGESDFQLQKFSLAEDEKDLIPLLKEILLLNPSLNIVASPWTPPAWMKTNHHSKGGSLKPDCYDVYARYLLKYIQEMQKRGIKIQSLTIQNEPLNPDNNPSLLMTQEEQLMFVKNHLGPTFRRGKVGTKIIVYDHNADRPDYPIHILNDAQARTYIDGSAFHLYGGNAEAMSAVHESHPDKHLYFTEQWIGAPSNFGGDLQWHIRNVLIGATRNWCKTVLEWNLASDPEQKMHTDGGCTNCLGAITIGNTIRRNAAYYIIAHASKFVPPRSVRIASNITMSLPNVAFKTPNGNTVVVVMNESDKEITFNIRVKQKQITPTLPAKSVATFVWK